MAYETPFAKNEKKAVGEKRDQAKFIADARKQLQYAIEVYDETRRDQLDDVRFAAATPDNMWQWPEAIKNARLDKKNAGGPRPVLTINKLPPHIRLVTNEQRQNRPAIHVLPVDSKADVDVAEMLNGVVRHVEANSDADTAYDIACENQVTHGEGYFRVLTDYVDEMSQEQDILIAPIRNSFSCYPDPDGLKRDPTGRYCKWWFITDRCRKDEFKAEYPKAQETNWDLVGTGDDLIGWVEDEHVTIAEYFCIKEEDAKIVFWPDGTVTKGDEMPKVAGQVPIKTKSVKLQRVMWTKMSPLEVLEEREWAGKYIPIVRVVGNEYEVDGKLVISGLVRNAKDACRMFNYWVSQEAEILALAPKAPFIGAAGQFEGHPEWDDANIVNYSKLEYEPVTENNVPLPPPQRSQPPVPPAGFINAKLGAADDIQSTIGQYNPSLGADAKEKTGKAIIARQRQADVGTFHYMDNLAKSIRQCGRIVIDLIPKIYDTRRVARILGEDGEPSHVTIDPDQQQAVSELDDGTGNIQKIYNPTVGVYDVRVSVGPSYTTQRQEAAQMMVELSQGTTDPQVALVMRYLAIKNMDWSGAEQLANIIKKLLPGQLTDEDGNGEGAEVSALKQQLQAMQQALEQLQNGMEAQKLDIERFNAETKRMEAESKDKARQFDATAAYVDRTTVDDTALLAPGGAETPQGAMQ